MSDHSIQLTPHLYTYFQKISLREPLVLKELREETSTLHCARMQISPEQGQLMDLLIKLLGAKRTLDIGTFTGYSALAVALAMPDEGRVIACDVSIKWTDIAKKYWDKAGVSHKVQLKRQAALTTLEALLAEGNANTFDFIFIDADKRNYDNYYELGLKLLRQGGLIAIDNVLWDGKVADDAIQDEDTVAIRTLNAKIHVDDRVQISLVPIGDGLTLAMKR